MSAAPGRAARSAARGASTPLMEQYLGVKQSHPDAFVFFRLGDFYEMFFDDAVEAAGLLGLTLTSRNKQDPDPVPMCGIPWHQRDAYTARLLRLGRKIAICEQLEDPALAKGLVQRGVTEILTPGSVTGETFLDPTANNFLCALWPAADRLGLCVADASTGEVRLSECAWSDAREWLERTRAAEWLVPDGAGADATSQSRLDAVLSGLPGARSRVLPPVEGHASLAAARFGAALDAFSDLEAAQRALALALEYLDRVQGGPSLRQARLERGGAAAALRYDAATARHLELFDAQPGGEAAHTLWHHLNLTVSAPGARRLRAWLERPLFDLQIVCGRHDRVAGWIAAGEARTRLRDALRALPDFERLAARIAAGRATPRDLGAVRDGLAQLPRLLPVLGDAAADAATLDALAVDPAVHARLTRALTDEPPPGARDGGVIRPGFDAWRDELDDLAHSGKRWIAELEATERARTGIGSLKVGYNRVFGYYLEVTRAHLDKVPGDFERRQTLTGAERFVTPALKSREQEVLSAEEKLRACELALFERLVESLLDAVPGLQRAAGAIASLDAESALAEAAVRYRWTRPVMEDSDRLRLTGARHPVVERLLPRGEFVPNALELDGATRQILLLTGPNMGGKSTYLRQIALAVLLAQSGSFVPAEAAVIGRVDRLFTRVGASDRLGSGQSTFMVEMSETADILRSATARSLVLLDEVGRGTATYDGLALAWAVTEHLHAAGGPRPRTVFATHYHELTQLAGSLPRLANVHVAVREADDQVVFLHRIAEGPADRSYGIHVAQRAGLPASVIARARDVLEELERERTVEHLGRGASGAGRDGKRAVDPAQVALPLFETPAHPLDDALRAVEPDALTPLDALRLIADWKRRWGVGPPPEDRVKP